MLRHLPAFVLVMVLAACVPPGIGEEADEASGAGRYDALQPTFPPRAPEPAHGGASPPNQQDELSSAGAAPSASDAENPPPTVPPSPTTSPLPSREAAPTPVPPDAVGSNEPASLRLSSRLPDDAGDGTAVPPSSPPDHADLVGSELRRDGGTFTLTHALRGGAPGEGDGEHTMNIATFVEVAGDRSVDYEIWANLSPNGWGTAYFDRVRGKAIYAADDGVAVSVTDEGLRLTFPASHLGGAERFRWSVASEWGRYEAIGTDAAARDYAPDDRTGWPFPGTSG